MFLELPSVNRSLEPTPRVAYDQGRIKKRDEWLMLNNRQVLRDKLIHLAEEIPEDQVQEVIQLVDFLMAKKTWNASVDQTLAVAGIFGDQPSASTEQLGWPSGFFVDVYGSTADDPLTEPEELPFETRESLH